jgi:8-oxo-dGTP pyrophosphatase MutT (NUDIX family)
VSARAAVALTLRDGAAGLELLFIRRAEHPLDPWSGQMAFPGGRAEASDVELRATAVRETLEEIGLDLDEAADFLGALDQIRAMSRMRPLDLVIQPFVFRVRGEPSLALSSEVTSVHWIPLDDLLSARLRGFMDYPHDDGVLKFPCFHVNGKTIWGLTFRMFANFESLLAQGRPGPSAGAATSLAAG